MKHSVKSLVAVAAAAFAMQAFADTEKANGFTWSYRLIDNGKSAEITSGVQYVPAILPDDPDGAVAIPAKLGGKPVTSIGDWAFYACQCMTAVTIPATVTKIGEDAFGECCGLEEVALPKGLKTIGDGAFYGTAMRSIVIPSGVTSIGDWAFYDSCFQSVVIPDSVASIGLKAFGKCSWLQYVQFGKKVASIGSDVLNGSSSLKALAFKGDPPANVHEYAFVGVFCSIYVPANSKTWPKGENGMPVYWNGLKVIRNDYLATVKVGHVGDGTVSGAGDYAVGKKAALKAVPAAGNVFCGWFWYDPVDEDYDFVGFSQSYSYPVTGENADFFVQFVSSGDDKLELAFSPSYKAYDDGTFRLSMLYKEVNTHSEPKLTFKNLPAGIKYDAKTFTLSGKATKPGVYKVTVSATNKTITKAKTQDFEIVVPNFTDDEIKVKDFYGLFIPGDYTFEDLSEVAEGCAVTGLPAGMKWTTKKIVDKTLGEIPAYSVYGAATKPGSYTVYFTKTTTDKVKHTATATFVVDEFPKLEIEKDGDGDGNVTGAGGYPAGKKVTIKATPDKDSVFEGWFDKYDNCFSKAANYSLTTGVYGETITAKFMTRNQDYDAISVVVDDSDVPAFNDKLVTEVTLPCGVRVYWPLLVDARSEATVKVSGLPTGLKFTAKDVVDPKTKEVIAYANTIYGAPTAASKTESSGGFTPRMIPSTVKIEVTTSGKTKKEYYVRVSVEAMPYWAATTFVGGDAYGGLASITVAGTGKISGKIIGEAGATETISASEFNYYTADDKEYETVVTMKQGQFVGGSVMTLTALEWGLSKIQLHAYKDCYLYSVPWKSCDPWITLAKKFTTAAAKTLEVKDVKDNDGNSGILTLQFDASGSVKAKGEFMVPDKNGRLAKYTASCSTFVAPITKIQFSDDEFDAHVYVSLPLKKDKFAGYSAKLALHWNGTQFVVK